VAIADPYTWNQKTYNNATSVVRRVFELGYSGTPRIDTIRPLRSMCPPCHESLPKPWFRITTFPEILYPKGRIESEDRFKMTVPGE